MAQYEMLPEGSVQNHSIWGNVGGFLSQAVGAYGQYEAIKAGKNSTGQGRIEQMYTPELDNAAAVQVEAPKVQAPAAPVEPMVFGFPQKQVIMAFGGLLVLGLILRGKK